jgi:hypothetical protein
MLRRHVVVAVALFATALSLVAVIVTVPSPPRESLQDMRAHLDAYVERGDMGEPPPVFQNDLRELVLAGRVETRVLATSTQGERVVLGGIGIAEEDCGMPGRGLCALFLDGAAGRDPMLYLSRSFRDRSASFVQGGVLVDTSSPGDDGRGWFPSWDFVSASGLRRRVADVSIEGSCSAWRHVLRGADGTGWVEVDQSGETRDKDCRLGNAVVLKDRSGRELRRIVIGETKHEVEVDPLATLQDPGRIHFTLRTGTRAWKFIFNVQTETLTEIP